MIDVEVLAQGEGFTKPTGIPMATAPRSRIIILWLLLGSLAAGVCSLIWPAAHLGNEYLPVGNDSFYHARRILDTAKDPASFYEFDSKIHAPEGSLLVWPWGYDYAMGLLVRMGIKMGIASDPMAILVWIPVGAVFVSMGMLLLVARQISLSLWSSTLAGICLALTPLTQYLHGVGFVDHHFAEYIFVLATLAFGLTWLRDLSAAGPAMVVGVILGIAPAIHNGLFILQIPVLTSLFILWLQGIRSPSTPTIAFCAALLTGTAAVLIPSEPFRSGYFEYFLLSWFHLYVACGTAIVVCFFSRFRKSAKSVSYLTTAAVILLIPLGYQISMAQAFLRGDLTGLENIGEMKSIRQLVDAYGALDVTNRYSVLLWFVPLSFPYCAYCLWRERKSGLVLFWIFSIGGLTLLLLQFRLHYFGSFALYLPWLLLIDRFTRTRPASRRNWMLAASVTLLLMYAPPLRNQLLGPMLYANDQYFLNLRPVLAVLQKACKDDPGIVLADNDAGHYIRYYTECSVIANNFLLTAQQGQKILEMRRLMGMSADELADMAPEIKYALVRPLQINTKAGSAQYILFSANADRLVADLLINPHATPPTPAPKRYELLHEAVIRDGDFSIPYARLYRVLH